MDKIVFFLVAMIVALTVLAIGGCIADYVLPRFKKLDRYLADIASQKKD